ncbi:TRAP transporter large permease [Bacillus sp. FJAT-45350]|uniref:TRAP transporter large permease n=1 Tax=Bacillus sp. FJAT-45350 TaxID=2011014 RepID=UPI000BB9664D|nr:TRAP transporter large permease subunit [Bacillus sp. FJAT-45350]
MEWWQLLLVILISLIGLMFLRVPVAFAFLMVNIVASFFIWGGEKGLTLLITSIENSLTNFSLLPIPLFILMGEIMFRAGIAPRMIETVDKWLGKLPGRLSLLAVGGGTLLSTLTASTMASTAMLGSTLIPEMEKQKYHKSMAMGPILGSGVLAVMIPPSALGVLLASMGQISVGAFLIAIIIPGILMAVLYTIFIIVWAKMNPHLAPAYDIQETPFIEKVTATMKYILPLGLIVFFVIGFMFLGIATPTEAAAMGVIASMILAICYRKLTLDVLIQSLSGTMKITVMILIVVSASTAFSQILSFSGATRNLVNLVGGFEFAPVIILLILLLTVIVLGTFLESLSIMMLVIPIFFPIVAALDFNLLWFAVLLLITIEIGTITPPFGVGLFVMKGVAPKGTKMLDIYTAAVPYILLQVLLLVLVILFPTIVTWLPDIMRN